MGTSSRVDATLSGGMSLQRLSGTVQPLGFTQYNLGRHSVLFENEYRLAMSLDPTSAVGFNLGGDLNGLSMDQSGTSGVYSRVGQALLHG